MNDAEVRRFLDIRYFPSMAFEKQWLEDRVKQSGGYSDVFFAIETLAEGRHIGNLGLRDGRPEDRKATFGIAIGDKDFWSRGYGTDATLTLLRFAFGEMNLHRIELHVDERNARAVA